jgi:endoplasmic reticulum chaperone BiP
VKLKSDDRGSADWSCLVVLLQVKKAVEEASEWLDENSDAEEEEYQDKLKELEDVASPIISAAYQAAGGAGGGDDEDLGEHDEL